MPRHKLLLILCLVGMAGCMLAPGSSTFAASPGENESAARYIVLYKGTAARDASAGERETAFLERHHGFHSALRFRSAVKGFSAALTSEQASTIRQDSQVAIVARDRRLQAANRVPLSPGDIVPSGVSRIGAASTDETHLASTAAVAVLDTGIDLEHPDLHAIAGVNCVTRGLPQDDNGHGTFVAGVVAAKNNGAGIVGVAPGTTVYAVKVIDSEGGGLLSQIICGIDWVSANANRLGIRVANMSLGGPGYYSSCANDVLHMAICNSTARGVVYAVAAGNDASNISIHPDHPASYPEVLTVTAMADGDGVPGGLATSLCERGERDDNFATFSSYATAERDTVHMAAAPGVCIRSTYPDDQYATASGTSAAAPHAAGVAALCFGEGGAPGPCTGLASARVIEKIVADAALAATADNGFAGDPSHPFGRHFGFLVPGGDPLPLREPAPPQAAPVDEVATDQEVTLEIVRARSRQRLRRLSVVAMLGERGILNASGTLRLPGSGRVVQFRGASKPALPATRVTLRLRLGRTSTRVAARYLRRHRSVKSKVTLVGRDEAGNIATAARTIRLTR